nr:hypothetical protein 1634Bnrm1_p103 [Cryptomonas sp.]
MNPSKSVFYNLAKTIIKIKISQKNSILGRKDIFYVSSFFNNKDIKKKQIKEFVKNIIKTIYYVAKRKDVFIARFYQHTWIKKMPKNFLKSFFLVFFRNKLTLYFSFNFLFETFQKIFNGIFILLIKNLCKTNIQFFVSQIFLILFENFLKNPEQEFQVNYLFLKQIENANYILSSRFICSWILIFNKHRCMSMLLFAKAINFIQYYIFKFFLNSTIVLKNSILEHTISYLVKNKIYNKIINLVRFIFQQKTCSFLADKILKQYVSIKINRYRSSGLEIFKILNFFYNYFSNKNLNNKFKNISNFVYNNIFSEYPKNYIVNLLGKIHFFNSNLKIFPELDPAYLFVYSGSSFSETIILAKYYPKINKQP